MQNDKLKIKNIAIVFVALLLLLLVIFFVPKYLVCQHQRSVIMELKQWEGEFEGVNSMEEAFDAIEGYEYISGYYVPGEGYFCSDKMSQKVEAQRSKVLATFEKALEEYTGLEYGSDLQKWKDWMKRNKENVNDGIKSN